MCPDVFGSVSTAEAQKKKNYTKCAFFFLLFSFSKSVVFCYQWFILQGRRRTRQRKIGNSGSRTELPNLNDHEAVQR